MMYGGYNGYGGGYPQPTVGYPQPTGYYNGGSMSDTLGQLRQQFQQATPNMQPMDMPQADDNGITWTQGYEGAKAYLVAPGKKKLLMDSEDSYFYLKETDMSGMPMPMRRFKYFEDPISETKTPLQSQAIPTPDYITREEFSALEARLNDLATAKSTEPENKGNNSKKGGN